MWLASYALAPNLPKSERATEVVLRHQGRVHEDDGTPEKGGDIVEGEEGGQRPPSNAMFSFASCAYLGIPLEVEFIRCNYLLGVLWVGECERFRYRRVSVPIPLLKHLLADLGRRRKGSPITTAGYREPSLGGAGLGR